MNIRTRITATAVLLGLALATLSGCAVSADARATQLTELRLGYFATVTHAPALVGVEQSLFDEALGDVDVEALVFAAGPAVVEALSAGAIDAAYLGPNPAINTFLRSGGVSVRVIAGATSGGASLVVRDGITSPHDLVGATLASPQFGNTQDVALRSWLTSQGLENTTSGGGDVRVTPTASAQTWTLFREGQLDGAWLPEPWVSRLVIEAGAHVLVDERELWPGGEFPTTVLVVRADFAAQHPDAVDDLLAGHLAALAWIDDHPAELAGVINSALYEATGAPLADAVLERALDSVTFSPDVHAEAFATLIDNGVAAGTQQDGSIAGLFDLHQLNDLLLAAGADPVDDAGLGVNK